MIELPRIRIAFHLLFPFIEIVCFFGSDTLPKFLSLFRRQALNLFQNFFHGPTHSSIVRTEGIEGKSQVEHFYLLQLTLRKALTHALPRISTRLRRVCPSLS